VSVLALLLAIGAVFATLPCVAQAKPHDATHESWTDPHWTELYGMLLVDQLEYTASDGDDTWRWDIDGWLGSDTHRLVFKSEGERNANGESAGDAELQLLYGAPVTPFWDLQVGGRYDATNVLPPDANEISQLEGFHCGARSKLWRRTSWSPY